MAQSSIIVLMLALCGAQRCSSFGAGSVPPLVSIAGQARVSVRGGASARGADRGHAALAMRSVGEAHFLERALTRRTALLLPAVAIVLCDHPLRAAAEANALKTDMLKLKVGLKGLNYLLDNFDNETTQCNYAQLDRALLAQDKKSELLEAATTNALFDKDNKYMIIKCKRNPSGIKQYLGLSSTEDPLYRATDMVKRCRKLVADDKVEAYVEAEEEFSNLIASAGSMTYSAMGGGGRAGAGADFSTFNEFKKGEKQDPRDIKFLIGAKKDIEKVRDTLTVIVASLPIPVTDKSAPVEEEEGEEEE